MSEPSHTQPQVEPIVLIPPTHEQSTPSFHVQAALLKRFADFLRERGVNIVQPPEATGQTGPQAAPLAELEIESGTPLDELERLRGEFLAQAEG